MSDRVCLECGTELTGRIDQKYCSDHCRNAWHNRQKAGSTPYVRKVTGILKKNRNIMEGLNPEGKVKITRKKLQDRGFNFNFYTNVYTTRAGTQYYFCYEHGYLPLEQGFVTLVKREEALPV